MQSGRPFSISGGFGNNQSLAGVNADRADLTGEPFLVRQGPKSQWLNEYFNRAAFQPNPPGTFGDSPRNLLEGPGTNNVDVGIAKNILFKERYSVQFRWEMFNAFNRTQFAIPNTDPTSPAFGRILSTAGPQRVMQFALKFFW
jgi:hypothetical protein